LTGLWQVSGRSDLDPEQSARLDTHYVEQWSPLMDAQILARTPGAVLSGKGAY
jgi:lipopolysaccharide/colanic/teichoic acid biosynthesis glycosyltransferase